MRCLEGFLLQLLAAEGRVIFDKSAATFCFTGKCAAKILDVKNKIAPRGIRTHDTRFKVWGANHYTMGAELLLLWSSSKIDIRFLLLLPFRCDIFFEKIPVTFIDCYEDLFKQQPLFKQLSLSFGNDDDHVSGGVGLN